MKSKTSKQYLSEIQKKNREQGGTGTIYAVAKMLGMSESRVGNYSRGKKLFDDEMCFKTAFVLGLNPSEVIASVNKERAGDSEKSEFWEDVLKKVAGTAAIILLAVMMIFPAFSNRLEAAQFNISEIMRSDAVRNMYYTKYLARLFNWLVGPPLNHTHVLPA